MNAYEMRIDQLNFNTTASYDNISAFSIGHESCIIKFFKVIQNPILLKFLEKQKQSESRFESLLRLFLKNI